MIVPPAVGIPTLGERTGMGCIYGKRIKRINTCRHGDEHRYIAIRVGTVTELTIAITTPAVYSPHSGQTTTVIIPGASHCERDTLRHTNECRYGAICVGAVAELLLCILTPAVDITGSRGGTGVCRACREGSKCDTLGHSDGHWYSAIGSGAVAELPFVVESPTIHGASGGEPTYTAMTIGNFRERDTLRHGNGSRYHIGKDVPSAEGAFVALPPTIDGTVGIERTGLKITNLKCRECDTRRHGDSNWHLGARGVAVARLILRIIAPTVCSTSSAEGTGVLRTYFDISKRHTRGHGDSEWSHAQKRIRDAAQLPPQIPPPTVCRTIGDQGTGLPIACTDFGVIAQHWCRGCSACRGLGGCRCLRRRTGVCASECSGRCRCIRLRGGTRR